jgi:hypothetical protein
VQLSDVPSPTNDAALNAYVQQVLIASAVFVVRCCVRKLMQPKESQLWHL